MIVQNNTLAELSLTVEQAFDFNTTLNAVQGALDVHELSKKCPLDKLYLGTHMSLLSQNHETKQPMVTQYIKK